MVQFYSDTFGFATFCCEVVCGMCVCGAHMFGVQRLILGEIPQELPIPLLFIYLIKDSVTDTWAVTDWLG